MRRQLMSLRVVVAALAVAAGSAHAQVSIPNIKGPINAAKKAADKTNEQTRAAEKVGDTPAQQKAAQAPQKSAPAPQKAGARTDSVSTPQPGPRRSAVAVYREVFSYSGGRRRDPFVSLMLSGELRPVITDLTLTGVVFDPQGRRSIAMLVDGSTGESYSVVLGQTLARMKVTRIGMEDVTFSIDEFGLSRSETLIIDKTKKAGPAPAPRRP